MRNKMVRQKTTDAVKILHKRYIKGDKKRLEEIEAEKERASIAEQIYALRIKAGLTQAELAERIGTTQSVISRLEDADYNGHTLAILRRIGKALEQKVSIQFVPDTSGLAIS